MRRVAFMAIIGAAMMCASCQKDLCNDHVHSTEIDVRFDWSLTKPDGASSMYMVLMPVSGESMEIEAPLPPDFIKTLSSFVEIV